MPGKFVSFLFSDDIFFLNVQKIISGITSVSANSLDPDQGQHDARPDPRPHCSQRIYIERYDTKSCIAVWSSETSHGTPAILLGSNFQIGRQKCSFLFQLITELRIILVLEPLTRKKVGN